MQASPHSGIFHQPNGARALENLPLEEVKVRAWVVDVSSRIVLSQKFHNPSNQPTGRAKYVFPLPAYSAVCAFELEMEDGSVIIGEVKENDEAALTFTNATKQGKTAALVERVTDDIFTISLGSIPATSRVTAHLTFVMDLLDEGIRDHIRLQLPMHIAKRYGAPPAGMQDASAADLRTRVHIWVDIQTSDVIREIKSPTHPIRRQRHKSHSGRKSFHRMSVLWESSEFLASDFVVTIYADGLDRPRCFAEVLDADDGESGRGSTIAMQLTLVPKVQAPKITSQEYIFVIDRSGSMEGDSIKTAKRTLAMLIRLLPSAQTTFNIFSFGTLFTSLWVRSQPYNPEFLGQATSHVESMDADYGGTEIANALHAAFNSRGLDRPAVVFLLTDGDVNRSAALNPEAVISDALRNSPPHAPMRLFVLGIGTGVSSDVCSSLARRGNGEYLLALRAEDIQGKCARLLNAGRSKTIESINIDWGHGPSSSGSHPTPLKLPVGIPELEPPPNVQQAPHSLKNYFSAIRFTVFAIISSSAVPTKVKLSTKLHGTTETQELVVDVLRVKPFQGVNECSAVPIVHTLAARRLLMDLDDGVGPLPTPVPGDALVASEDILRKAGMVRLGLTYQLVSKYTSFLAVRNGNEQARNSRSRSGGMAWARSRLQRTKRISQQRTSQIADSEPPDLIDGIINDLSSLFSSVVSFLGGGSTRSPRTSPNQYRSQRGRRPSHFPGAYNGSDSGATGESDGSLRRRPGSPASHYSSAASFSTLSSIDGSSSCGSSCWTSSRSPSPAPDPVDRAPSPVFLPPPAPGQISSYPMRRRTVRAISQDTHMLSHEMAVDGSFTPTPLLKRLVGHAVLDKGRELGVEDKVWATVAAVAYMQMHLQGDPELLELLLEKTRGYVLASAAGGQRYDERQFDEWVREAVALLRNGS